VPVDGIEPEPTHRAGQRVERATHVDRLDRHKHPHRRGQAQHARSASTIRRSVSAVQSSPTSTRNSPT
jgi:hypothetical protein